MNWANNIHASILKVSSYSICLEGCSDSFPYHLWFRGGFVRLVFMNVDVEDRFNNVERMFKMKVGKVE